MLKQFLLTFSVLCIFCFTIHAESSAFPTHAGKTFNIDWNLTSAKLKANGAILTSSKYNIYEYDNLVLFQFTPDGKLKRVSIRYSGESTRFCDEAFERMLKYYYERDIFCKIEHYQKIGMMSSMLIWFDVPGNVFIVLEHLIVQTRESQTSTVFIHAYNSKYYSKANIVKEYKRTD